MDRNKTLQLSTVKIFPKRLLPRTHRVSNKTWNNQLQQNNAKMDLLNLDIARNIMKTVMIHSQMKRIIMMRRMITILRRNIEDFVNVGDRE